MFSPALTQLVVNDIDTSIDYYESVLGFETTLRHETSFASLSRDKTEIHLVAGEEKHPVSHMELEGERISAYIWVSDFDALYKEYEAAGADFVYPPTEHVWGAVNFCVKDRDGYRICFARAALS